MKLNASILAILLSTVGSTYAFQTIQRRDNLPKKIHKIHNRHPYVKSSIPSRTSLNMWKAIALDASTILPVNPVGSIRALILDPVFEAAALSDMAHFALDIITFMAPETSIMVRGFAVVGHLLCIASDYILSHDLMTQDLVLHVGMLGISVQLLIKSLLPIMTAVSEPLTVQDKRTYVRLFRPAGVSPLQFRAASKAAFEWVDYEPEAMIYRSNPNGQCFTNVECDEDGCFFWLYHGDVTVSLNDVVVENLNRRRGISAKGQNEVGLLGDVEYSDVLKYKKRSEPKRPDAQDGTTYQETIKAGDQGATLLKIKTSKLTELMDNDEELSESIQMIVLKDIQHKIGVLN